MTLKRSVYQDLLAWKDNPSRIPLLIQGLRQTGKTTIALEFANREYENAFYVDFRKSVNAHRIFEGDFDIDSIAFAISALPRDKRLKTGKSLVPGKTVIILDEIQDCPNARSCLKYFKEDGRYDVLASGSLLGVKGYRQSKKASRGIGVGSEDYLLMHPLSFEEFLLASPLGDGAIPLLKDCFACRRAVPPYFHQALLDLFLQYMVVGGMPEAVSTFFSRHDYQATRAVQKRILRDCEADFGTHLNDDLALTVDDAERALIGDAFHSIPRQLAKENKKFQYSVIRPKGDSRTYGFALRYLQDYGLVLPAYNLSALDSPLEHFAKEDNFKIYLCDSGLFVAMLDHEIPSLILSGELGSGKGMLFENMLAEAYGKFGKSLYFYRKESGLEVDFVDSFDGDITLIEVKAKTGATKSSSTLLKDDKCKAKHLIRVGSTNLGVVNNILTIPHYMLFLLRDFHW